MSRQLQQLIAEKNWEQIVREFSHDDLTRILPFKDAMLLASDLFFENFGDYPSIGNFAIDLFFAIRKYKRDEWNKDWKNDTFLGTVCQLGYKYDESYFCCMRAFKKFSDPPAGLLRMMANCHNVPSPRISVDEAELLLKRSFQKEPSYDTALMLKSVYLEKDDEYQRKYWDEIMRELEQKNIRARPCEPDVFEKEPQK